MSKRFLTHEECFEAARRMYKRIFAHGRKRKLVQTSSLYAIPRGGVPVAYLLGAVNPRFCIVSHPPDADFFVDDLIDSGATRDRYKKQFPYKPFFTLAKELIPPKAPGEWLVFPWEGDGEKDQSATDIPTRLLQFIGEDPKREGLRETPERFLKAWQAYTSGYSMDVASILKTFEDGCENYDEMILVKNIPFFSMCEHHLAPFFGEATIGYIPDKKIVGLSKLGRVLEAFSRRLQVQERMTTQIAHHIQEALSPKGVGVLVHARHLCMEARGLSKPSRTTTSALLGAFRAQEVRQEFLKLAT